MVPERLLPHTALDGLHRRRRLRLAWLRASGRVLTFTTAALRRVLDVATAAILSAATGPIAIAAMIMITISHCSFPTRQQWDVSLETWRRKLRGACVHMT